MKKIRIDYEKDWFTGRDITHKNVSMHSRLSFAEEIKLLKEIKRKSEHGEMNEVSNM